MKEMVSIPYKDSPINAYITAPASPGVYPGLLLIEEIWGLNDHIKSVCDRFASEGYIVLSPELIDAEVLNQLSPEIAKEMWSEDEEKKLAAQAKMREATAPVRSKKFSEETIAKLKHCVDYMFADKRFNGNVGLIGFCFGGTYAFQLAINDSRISAAVPFYGQVPDPIEDVGKITCPILNFNGGKDENIMAKLPDLVSAMKKYDRDYSYITYPDAGHAFFNDTNERAYNKEAALDAWENMILFLKKHLV